MSRETSRWTYIHGTRPEGCIVYDEPGIKFHSHHDTDPARGQHSAFDLVRLHRFGHLDVHAGEGPVVDRPSYQAMVEWANSLPEIRAARAVDEFQDLGDLPVATEEIPDGQPPRFQVRAAGDFSSGPPMDWIVRGVLPRAELTVIFGESGSGKSFLALDLCAAISRGLEWRSRRTRRGRVVYVCAEGAGGFKARLQAYARGHSVEFAKLPAVIADAPNLLDVKDAAAVTKAIADWGKVDVVVIDTLSASTPGGNENSGEDMGLVVSHCKLIHAKTGALVVLIHHSGKDAARGARGWSGLRAAADAEIEVTRNGDYRNAAITKMKDGSDGDSFAFKLKVVDLGFDADGEARSSCIIEHVDAAPEAPSRKARIGVREQIVLDLVKTMAPTGTMNQEDLVEGYKKKVSCDPDKRDQRRAHVFAAMRSLEKDRLIFKHGEDRVSLTSLVTTGDEESWLG